MVVLPTSKTEMVVDLPLTEEGLHYHMMKGDRLWMTEMTREVHETLIEMTEETQIEKIDEMAHHETEETTDEAHMRRGETEDKTMKEEMDRQTEGVSATEWIASETNRRENDQIPGGDLVTDTTVMAKKCVTNHMVRSREVDVVRSRAGHLPRGE